VGQPTLGKDPYTAGRDKMASLTFLLDDVIPILSNLMDFQFDPNAHLLQDTVEGAESVFHLCLDLPEFLDAYHKGEYKKMMTIMLTAFASNTMFRQVFINRLTSALTSAAAKSGNISLW